MCFLFHQWEKKLRFVAPCVTESFDRLQGISSKAHCDGIYVVEKCRKCGKERGKVCTGNKTFKVDSNFVYGIKEKIDAESE